MATREEILDELLDRLRNIDPEVDVSQGSFSYTMASLMAYLVESQNKIYESIESNLNLNTDNYTLLQYIGKPRIGEPFKATNSIYKYKVLTEEVTIRNNNQFIDPKNNQRIYRVRSSSQSTIESVNVGATYNLRIGDQLVMTGYGDIFIEITDVIELGRDNEDIESYRQRYISSLLIDQQPGIMSYYKNILSMDSRISACGICKDKTYDYTVVAYILNQNYEPFTSIEKRNIQEEYQASIVPIPQILDIECPTNYPVSITFTITTIEGKEITEEILKPILEDYRIRFIRELMNTNSIQKVLKIDEVKQYVGERIIDRGYIQRIVFNDEEENITFTQQYLTWASIHIEV